jgi:hypothetical protein
MPTFVFETEHAKKYGVHEAVILYNFIFWIKHNKANKKHFHEGRYWTYNTVKAFEELFPFLTKSQIRTALNNLQSKGAILTGNYNKLSFDRTVWYTVTDELYAENIDDSHLLKITNAFGESDKSHLLKITNGIAKNSTTIPDIKPYNKPYGKSSSTPSMWDKKPKQQYENFEQRDYNDKDLEKYYANLNIKKDSDSR